MFDQKWFRRFGALILALTAATNASAGRRVTLRMSFSSSFSGAEVDVIKEAYRQAYRTAFSCSYLRSEDPELRRRLLNRFRTHRTRFLKVGANSDDPYECARTYGIFDRRIRIRPAAFGEGCESMKAVVFHEMIHTVESAFEEEGWVGRAAERRASHFEVRCTHPGAGLERGIRLPSAE